MYLNLRIDPGKNCTKKGQRKKGNIQGRPPVSGSLDFSNVFRNLPQ